MRTIQRDIVGPFIFSSDNKILLGKSHKGGVFNNKLMIPGGGVEPGETRLEAVIREILEEVGIDITDFYVKEVDKVSFGRSKKVLRDTQEIVTVDMTFYNFVVQTNCPAGDIKITSGDDFVEATWYPIASLSELDLASPTKSVLQELGYHS